MRLAVRLERMHTRNGGNMSKKQHGPSAHGDPWAADPRPDVPASYTAPITAALIRCQHCERPVELTSEPATAPAVTCTSCMRHTVSLLLGTGEPPF
jgi:hypothetical protein